MGFDEFSSDQDRQKFTGKVEECARRKDFSERPPIMSFCVLVHLEIFGFVAIGWRGNGFGKYPRGQSDLKILNTPLSERMTLAGYLTFTTLNLLISRVGIKPTPHSFLSGVDSTVSKPQKGLSHWQLSLSPLPRMASVTMI